MGLLSLMLKTVFVFHVPGYDSRRSGTSRYVSSVPARRCVWGWGWGWGGRRPCVLLLFPAAFCVGLDCLLLLPESLYSVGLFFVKHVLRQLGSRAVMKNKTQIPCPSVQCPSGDILRVQPHPRQGAPSHRVLQ